MVNVILLLKLSYVILISSYWLVPEFFIELFLRNGSPRQEDNFLLLSWPKTQISLYKNEAALLINLCLKLIKSIILTQKFIKSAKRDKQLFASILFFDGNFYDWWHLTLPYLECPLHRLQSTKTILPKVQLCNRLKTRIKFVSSINKSEYVRCIWQFLTWGFALNIARLAFHEFDDPGFGAFLAVVLRFGNLFPLKRRRMSTFTFRAGPISPSSIFWVARATGKKVKWFI